MLEGAATPILTALGGILTLAGALVTIFFLTVFMLIFGGRVIRAALAEARPERRQIYESVLHKIYRSIGGYLSGLTLICTINATLTTTFLAINRVPFFLPLGILSGASSTIPYAGPFVTGTLISLIALVTGGAWHGLASAIYFILYGQLEGNVLSPLIFRRTVHVNPLVVTVSVLFLGEIAGIIGAIVAVPVVAALQIIVREILRERRQQLELQRNANQLIAQPRRDQQCLSAGTGARCRCRPGGSSRGTWAAASSCRARSSRSRWASAWWATTSRLGSTGSTRSSTRR